MTALQLNSIICGDNCHVLCEFPPESVSMVLTSPPYDDLRSYGGLSWDFYGLAWLLKRVLKPGGVIVWVVNDQTKNGSETLTSARQALHFRALGLNLHDTMVWHKTNPPPQTKDGRRYTLAHEFMYIFSKGSPATYNELRVPCAGAGVVTNNRTQRSMDGTIREDRSEARRGAVVKLDKPRQSVWEYANTGSRGHPAAFPLNLAKDHIVTWSNPGDVVLDPFAGGGTTLKAAAELKRQFVGIEINPDYCAEIEDWLKLSGTNAGPA
jgi:DNA modification methylase